MNNTDLVTHGMMVDLNKNENIPLSQDFINTLEIDQDRAVLVVFSPKTSVIKILPTRSSDVVKIGIDIGKLGPNFLRHMGSLFAKWDFKTLYSTGLCFTQESCVYEGYIDSSDIERNDLTVESIIGDIESIDGVKGVRIDRLKL